MDPGLCGRCRWCRVVETARSRFYLCRRSFDDPAYPKYPRLPVVACAGHEEGRPETSSGSGREMKPG